MLLTWLTIKSEAISIPIKCLHIQRQMFCRIHTAAMLCVMLKLLALLSFLFDKGTVTTMIQTFFNIKSPIIQNRDLHHPHLSVASSKIL